LTTADEKNYVNLLQGLVHKVFKEEWIKTMLARGADPEAVMAKIDEYWDNLEQGFEAGHPEGERHYEGVRRFEGDRHTKDNRDRRSKGAKGGKGGKHNGGDRHNDRDRRNDKKDKKKDKKK
jgi:hypothetical protein